MRSLVCDTITERMKNKRGMKMFNASNPTLRAGEGLFDASDPASRNGEDFVDASNPTLRAGEGLFFLVGSW